MRPHQELVKVQYFTARINQAAEQKRRRQLTYLCHELGDVFQ